MIFGAIFLFLIGSALFGYGLWVAWPPLCYLFVGAEFIAAAIIWTMGILAEEKST